MLGLPLWNLCTEGAASQQCLKVTACQQNIQNNKLLLDWGPIQNTMKSMEKFLQILIGHESDVTFKLLFSCRRNKAKCSRFYRLKARSLQGHHIFVYICSVNSQVL